MIIGGDNDDVLIGGEGKDSITGKLGADNISGGSEEDSFNYNLIDDSTSDNPDFIEDFEVGIDVINLTPLGFNSLDDFTITIEEENTIITSNINNFGLTLKGEIQLTADEFIFNDQH